MEHAKASASPAPDILPRPDHPISRADISKSALKVLYRLKDAGYQAFLVGGSVRDLLLGLHPKDFDVATDARPEEVHDLFRNSRLIGRRFRLAHVRFGREIIEVATFRAAKETHTGEDDVAHDEEGRILRDNVYGSIDEDVWRRDFTCNALYYNIADFSVWDYVGGVGDIRDRRLRLIGDAETRLREDPVRMLRAVRFAAKLGFEIDRDIREAMPKLAELIANVPPARLFDEFLKLFQTGHAEATFELLERHGLFAELYPDTAAALHGEDGARMRAFIRAALVNTDKRVRADKPVTPMFLLGVLLWAPIRDTAARLREKENMSEAQALGTAAWEVAGRQQGRIAVPRRYSGPMREMLALQPRFERRRGKRALGLLEHRRFRAAYDFLVLRARAGEVDEELAEFWTEVQTLGGEERAKAFGAAGGGGGGKRKSRRRRRGGRRAKRE